jgi:hypothetical protein
MITEELVKGSRPLAIEIEYADEPGTFVDRPSDVERGHSEKVPSSKKDQIMALFQSGLTDIAQIARHVAARPSYIGQVLQAAGFIAGYCDLYTTTGREQNIYSRFFRNVLSFRTVEAARESVEKIDQLYNYFERLGDRAGQHQAMVLALTGKNRARWSGKPKQSEIFSEWLAGH